MVEYQQGQGIQLSQTRGYQKSDDDELRMTTRVMTTAVEAKAKARVREEERRERREERPAQQLERSGGAIPCIETNSVQFSLVADLALAEQEG